MARHLSNIESIFIAGLYADIAALKAVNTSSGTDFPDNIWAFVDGQGEYYLDRADSLSSESLPTVVLPTTGAGRWKKKTITNTSNNLLIKKISGSGGGGSSTSKHYLSFSLPGSASGTIGLLSKGNINTNNPGGLLPTTSPYNLGIDNGGVDPYLICKAGTLSSVTITLGRAAVSTGSVNGAGVSIRFELFKIGYNTRTQIGVFDIPIDRTKVGIWNDTSGDGFQTATVSGLTIALGQGDLIGIQFTNQTGDNVVNAVKALHISVEIQS